jgi:Fe-Mn family superoxide dismutase
MSRSSSRRSFLRQSLQGGMALSAASMLPGVLSSCAPSRKGSGTGPWPFKTGFSQQPLGYAYNALEPVIDAQTMDIHFNKHAAAYSKNLKDAAQAEGIAADATVESVLAGVSKYSTKVRNNAGGHYNHELFWRLMKPNGEQQAAGKLAAAIESSFGSFGNFKMKFNEAAMTRFGSGWAWLYIDPSKALHIGSTPNQDNPLMDLAESKGLPLLGLDVWEHAYYLKYQNRRADYVDGWWKVVNWDFVQKRYEAVI